MVNKPFLESFSSFLRWFLHKTLIKNVLKIIVILMNNTDLDFILTFIYILLLLKDCLKKISGC